MAKKTHTDTALINNFATRCFRDRADADYIAARLCYRNGLVEHFQWSALQALEKYFKAIFLYNRLKAKKIGHRLDKALNKSKDLKFHLKLSDETIGFIEHINGMGRFRYLEVSYFTHGPKLYELDTAVWEVRRYCHYLDYDIELPDGTKKNMLDVEIKRIEASLDTLPSKFSIIGGKLERIIEDKGNSLRPALIWQNRHFAPFGRRSIRALEYSMSENAPFYLHPEVMDLVIDYVVVPDDVEKAFRKSYEDNKTL